MTLFHSIDVNLSSEKTCTMRSYSPLFELDHVDLNLKVAKVRKAMLDESLFLPKSLDNEEQLISQFLVSKRGNYTNISDLLKNTLRLYPDGGQRLNLSGSAERLSSDDLTGILKEFSGVNVLYLNDSQADHKFLESISKKAFDVLSLCYNDCFSSDELSGFPKVRWLDLSFTNISRDGCCDIAKYTGKCLQFVRFRNCTNLSLLDILEFVKKCSKLKVLDISGNGWETQVNGELIIKKIALRKSIETIIT
jgi:hypothetical protein